MMVSALMAALIALTMLCMLLGWACYRLSIDMKKAKLREASRRKEWLDEKNEVDRYLSGVLRVLKSNVGGIRKRICESAESAEELESKAPDLFRQCDGLANWLHANDQFLVSLYALAAEGIDREHQRRVDAIEKTGRGEVFYRIYEAAGLPSPSV